MTNQLDINLFHFHYTLHFDRDKLFLGKSSIILLIANRISEVNEQGLSCARWVKDIWNSKEENGWQNCKSYMLKPFCASIFAKNVFKDHGINFCIVNNGSLKSWFLRFLQYLRPISVEHNYQQSNCS